MRTESFIEGITIARTYLENSRDVNTSLALHLKYQLSLPEEHRIEKDPGIDIGIKVEAIEEAIEEINKALEALDYSLTPLTNPK